jgi:hypothetical protein
VVSRAGSVLEEEEEEEEEDVMLGFSDQIRHGCVESETRIGESMAQQAGWAAQKFLSHAPMRLVREREAGEPKQYHV